MRISVIVPAYNEESMIGRTLASIRNQDCQEAVEIIVVDNGSTDNTALVAREAGAGVVRENKPGYVFALRRGFEAASGDILITTDADTIVPRNWITRLVEAFDHDPEVVAVGGMVEFYDANWKGRIFERCILPAAIAYDRLCFSYPHLWGACMAVRRDAFLRVGGWTGKFNLQADTDVSRRLARIGKVIMVRQLKVSTSARRFNHGLLLNLFIFGVNFLGLQLLRRPVFFNFPSIRTGASGTVVKRERRGNRWSVFLALLLLLALAHGARPSNAWCGPKSSGRYIKHVATQEKIVALTFDDGPNEPYTSEILKVLRASDVRATFFLIGKNVNVYADAAREIVRAGHAVGNHTYSHPFFLILMPFGRQGRELDRDEQIIERETGVRCALFRPPHGFRSPWLLRAAARRGLTTIGWSNDGSDWHNVTGKEIADKIVRRARPGNIILLHDGLNLAHGVDRSRTVAALPAIISGLRSQGYRFVTIPELLAVGGFSAP